MLWVLTFLSIVGVVLNIKKDRRGFALWMFTNGCWAYIDYQKGLEAQAFLFLVYFFLSFWGWLQWKGNVQAQ